MSNRHAAAALLGLGGIVSLVACARQATPGMSGKDLLRRGMQPIVNRNKLLNMPFASRPRCVAIRGARAHGGSGCP